MQNHLIKTEVNTSQKEFSNREQLVELFKQCPIPENEMLANLGLFMHRQVVTRMLYYHDLYQKILSTHGVIMEFGCRWGNSLSLFESFRGIYEPYNYNRKIIGFDTFEGFASTDAKDGRADIVETGAMSVTSGYNQYLEKVLQCHENESPVSHIKKFELVKGDVCITLERYLEEHPETIIAMACFDVDLYQPTKKALEIVKTRITKGSILTFDEINHWTFPGETIAVMEELGLDKYKLQHSPYSTVQGYMVIE